MSHSLPNFYGKDKQIDVFELICAWIALTSLSSIAFLVLGIFDPINSVIAGTVLFLIFIHVFRLKLESPNKNYSLALLIILTLALFLRTQPYLWVMGGQDQGIYVNMSATYAKTGQAFVTDHVRETLEDREKAIYDDTNHHSRFKVKTADMRGFHQAGVYISDLNKSEYVFQFYPMHPLWMAIFGDLFGSGNRVYSIVFFSLISILAFYFISLQMLPDNRKSAYLIAIFLALNPLHAFFSKFPASEIVSLTFASTGFYFLIKYYKDSQKGQHHFWRLIISACLFLALFLNHISGFLYLPLFFLIALLSIVFLEDTKSRQHLVSYCGLILLGYALSVLYGYFFSFPYFWQVGEQTFGVYFGEPWYKAILYAIFLGGVIVLLCHLLKTQIRKLISKISPHITSLFPLILYLFIVIGIYQVYQLTFTDKWAADPYIGKIFGIANQGLTSVFASRITKIIIYLTPIGFVLFLLGINFFRKKKDVVFSLFFFFLVTSWLMRVVMDPVVLYEYYFSRYSLAEIIPYSLLIASLYLGILHQEASKKIVKILTTGSVIAILLLSLTISSFQLRGREAEGPSKAIEHISRQVDENDIVLLYGEHLMKTLGTPISYYYHLNNMMILDFSQVNWTSLFTNYGDIYVVSQNEIPFKNLELVDTFNYYEKVLEHTTLIPRNFVIQNNLKLSLYKTDRNILTEGNVFETSILTPSLFERINFSEDNGWTYGTGILDKVSYILKPDDSYIVLYTGGRSPYANDLQKLQLKLLINDKELVFVKQEGTNYIFEIDKSVPVIQQIKIQSSTFIPKEVGMGQDERTLGIDVLRLEIKKNI